MFKEALDLFSYATGTVYSAQKSQFLEAGRTSKELTPLEELLPYEVKPLDDDFKYLGFFLKPNCYAINDWRCLIKRVEKKISSCYHRWLTLGRRYILINSVLESISVYWLSMENIPKRILNRIRRRMFSFMWSGKKEIDNFHLVSKDRIAKHKECREWGFKNISSFGKACGGVCLVLDCDMK